MRTINAVDGQSLVDIAIQESGSAEALPVLMFDNPSLPIDTSLVAGQAVVVRDEVIRKDIRDYLRLKRFEVAKSIRTSFDGGGVGGDIPPYVPGSIPTLQDIFGKYGSPGFRIDQGDGYVELLVQKHTDGNVSDFASIFMDKGKMLLKSSKRGGVGLPIGQSADIVNRGYMEDVDAFMTVSHLDTLMSDAAFLATQEKQGMMSPADKQKLDTLYEGGGEGGLPADFYSNPEYLAGQFNNGLLSSDDYWKLKHLDIPSPYTLEGLWHLARIANLDTTDNPDPEVAKTWEYGVTRKHGAESCSLLMAPNRFRIQTSFSTSYQIRTTTFSSSTVQNSMFVDRAGFTEEVVDPTSGKLMTRYYSGPGYLTADGPENYYGARGSATIGVNYNMNPTDNSEFGVVRLSVGMRDSYARVERLLQDSNGVGYALDASNRRGAIGYGEVFSGMLGAPDIVNRSNNAPVIKKLDPYLALSNLDTLLTHDSFNATTSKKGWMTPQDKLKLDSFSTTGIMGGYLNVKKICQSGETTYNLTDADHGCLLVCMSNVPVTIGRSLFYETPMGWNCLIMQGGTGTITFISVNSSGNEYRSARQYGVVSYTKFDNYSYLLGGEKMV